MAQIALIAVVDGWIPWLYDQEYSVRLDLLRRRMAENPDRPLLLVVGSSRIGQGFRPEALPPLRTPTGETVLPFNFAHVGAGPRLNFMTVDRLLRQQQIRPRWMVLEVVPLTLAHEMVGLAISNMGARDLLPMKPYISPGKLASIYLRNRLIPWSKHRQGILRSCAPDWFTAGGPQDVVTLEPLGGDTRWLVKQNVTEVERRRLLDEAHAEFREQLTPFQMDPNTDRALRAELDRCRQEAIPVVLLLTPESSECRSWYPPTVAAWLDDYIATLAREHELRVVDARAWIPDHLFHDGHHLLAEGADLFTRYLGERVFQPLVEGTFSTEPDSQTNEMGPHTLHE